MSSNYRFSEYNVFRKDNDGNKYVIPVMYADEFDELLAAPEAKIEFETKFRKFRII